MPLALEWREAARRDLLAIVDYISDESPDSAQRLKDEIEMKAAKLPSRPKVYRLGRVPGTREIVIRPT
ncbi:type II toxin-antitoxin system RelE/ParE family toxin [Asticcacaulis benevestitus]|uniref:type II toxin-antitoxin system RelE/ParE family toxin n=1 Tax=Asticcacaulis benevestitus TaxID=347481 RepID=UPI00039BB953|nr:type II toxin-antitoxin system RelE/ParE family toxin [Asticcacaulis benevestitus]